MIRLDDGHYRLYYTTINPPEMRLAVAESSDGLSWERLQLDQMPGGGPVTNRLMLTGLPALQDQVAQPQVSRLPDGRWQMLYWHHQHGWGRESYLYTVAESADGLRWHVPNYDSPALNAHWLGEQSGLSDADRVTEKARRTNDADFV